MNFPDWFPVTFFAISGVLWWLFYIAYASVLLYKRRQAVRESVYNDVNVININSKYGKLGDYLPPYWVTHRHIKGEEKIPEWQQDMSSYADAGEVVSVCRASGYGCTPHSLEPVTTDD